MSLETNVKQAVPFFAVSNIEESVRYYVNGLAFEMANQLSDPDGYKIDFLSPTDVAEETEFQAEPPEAGPARIDT